jgi:hypothetical protein
MDTCTEPNHTLMWINSRRTQNAARRQVEVSSFQEDAKGQKRASSCWRQCGLAEVTAGCWAAGWRKGLIWIKRSAPPALFKSWRTRSKPTEALAMTGIKKHSVEKALNELRKADAPKSQPSRQDRETAAIEEEIARMTAQRLRLERLQQKRK